MSLPSKSSFMKPIFRQPMTRPARVPSLVALATASLCLVALHPAAAQGPARPAARPPAIPTSGVVPREPAAEQRLLEQFKAPEGFQVTLFAGPPVAMYPTCVGESPDGAVFVCVDPNLSLSVLKGVGRVMRLVDTDGDGHADRYTTFAQMDSPRGVATDGRSVYVMHPPNLTAYRDTNGDGISDSSKVLVTGLGFDLDFRGADHTTNNIQMGPDGWIYVAVGDYGFRKAVGVDGREISNRGGAVVRVRPDGTGLEIVNVGTRNIYDVAIDPFARLYARDNTNDGDGWNTRLHYLPAGANMGYPSLYQNFATEHFPTMFDYGAGSGVGSLWLQDPAWPAGLNNTLLTADWTTQRVYKHALAPKGGNFTVQQDTFLNVLRPADLTIDASSNLYVASLAGGQFTYNSDTVGYIVRVRPNGLVPKRIAPFARATDAALLLALGSPVYVGRLHAQHELLRRGPKAATVRRLGQLVADERRPADVRASAIFTLKQLAGARANAALLTAASSADARVRETALRALADRTDQLQGVTSAPFVKALGDADPQVQVQAIQGLVRIGARDAADALIPVAGGSDPALAHLAVRALAALGAFDVALRALDGAPAARDGALRALAQMHSPAVVTALVDRVGRATDAGSRAALVRTLARLHHRENAWKGDWWTTRPAHLGPYFDPAAWDESPRIRTALVTALGAATGGELTTLANDLALNQVLPRGAVPLVTLAAESNDPLRAQLVSALVGRTQLDTTVLALATQLDAKSPAFHAAVTQLLAGESALPAAAMPLARVAALDAKLDPAVRSSLLTSIGQAPGQASLQIAADVFARLNPAAPSPAPTPAASAPGAAAAGGAPSAGVDPIEGAWRRFVGDRRRAGESDYFIGLAKTGTPAQRTLAFAVLAQSIRTPRTPAALREKIAPVIDAAWSDAASTPSLVHAIALMRLESQYAERLAAYRQSATK
jgi:putative membrane-bound dehydrogenase-like protein